MRLTDLTALRQRNNESVPEFIQRFCDVRSRCYSLNLSDGQLAGLAFQGLMPTIKERFSSQEFESLGHIIQRVSAQESHYQDFIKDKYPKKVAQVMLQESDLEDEADIGLAEWTRNKKPVSCPWVKDNTERYSFDINKAD